MITKTCDKTISKDMAVASYFGLRVDVLWKTAPSFILRTGNS